MSVSVKSFANKKCEHNKREIRFFCILISLSPSLIHTPDKQMTKAAPHKAP